MTQPLLQARGLVMDFPGVRALDDVSIDVIEGEILGLVGENGAGKSTLMKIIAGVYQAGSGTLSWQGEELTLGGPADAINRGIEVIQQELSLVPQLTAAENMMIGSYPASLGRVQWRMLHRRAKEIADVLRLDIDLRQPASALSPAAQRLVMIGRALARRGKLLIMDEPTVSLPETEVRVLHEVIRRLREDGVAVVYVSHRLDEILELTDRVTVMKDACVVDTLSTPGLTKPRLMSLIVGRDLEELFPEQGVRESGEPLVSVKGLYGGNVHDVSFELYRGEVLGLAGLVGSGRTEVARMVFGADEREAGVVTLGGEPLRAHSPGEAIRRGMALLPEDRRNQGGVMRLSVAANISLPSVKRFRRFGAYLDAGRERTAVAEFVERLHIATPSVRQPLKYLSGGNQQKALIAKWLMREAQVFIFDEPTVGVDVGAKAEIYQLIAELAERGAGVIVISSEIEEITGLCQRVLVMREGSLVGEFRGSQISESSILQLCFAA